ncbi:MAG: helix-turn-helix domain-containing protein [Thermodesulfobacteriota bacterium]
MASPTLERILDGAAAAVALHGLAKLEMGDVCESAAISRGTLYRYFPSRDALLDALAKREAMLFKQRMLAAIAAAPSGPERILVALEYGVRQVRDHPALQRLIQTDPALVLRGLREQFESLKGEFADVLVPLLRQTDLVRRKVVTAEQLADWMMRLMVSAYLFPDPRPEETARSMTAVFRILSADVNRPAAVAPGATRARRAGAKR